MATQITTTRLSAEEEIRFLEYMDDIRSVVFEGGENSLLIICDKVYAELTALRSEGEENAHIVGQFAESIELAKESARREALESAAKEIEDSGCPYCGEMAGRDYADAIRSLAQPSTSPKPFMDVPA